MSMYEALSVIQTGGIALILLALFMAYMGRR